MNVPHGAELTVKYCRKHPPNQQRPSLYTVQDAFSSPGRQSTRSSPLLQNKRKSESYNYLSRININAFVTEW